MRVRALMSFQPLLHFNCLIQSFCEQHYDMDSEITSNCCSLLLLSLLLLFLLLLGEHRDKVDSNYLHKCDSSIAHEYVHS
jgi:hypothetical protein